MGKTKKAEKHEDIPGDETYGPHAPVNDVFDEAIAARQAGQEPTTQVTVDQAEQSVGEDAEKNASAVGRRKFAPDPFGGTTVSLSSDPKGMKARFLRSNENEAMLIQFSENPGKEITDQLKEAGMHWEPRAVSDFAKGAWIMRLEPGKEWRNHAHAQEMFHDVVNQIREKNGMEAFVPGAGQSI